MAWPSWFPNTPTGSRPTTWDDWTALFKQVIPRQWPTGLFGRDGNAWKDLTSMGESYALVRDLLQFLQRYLWPTKDDGGVFVPLWEEVFNISPAGSLTTRKNRLIATMRQRGTMTEDLIKALFAPAFGSNDADSVGLESPTQGWTASDDTDGAFLGNNMHIYSADESTEPDPMIIDLIAKVKPTWQIWSYGQYKRLKWGTPGEEGTWDHATYG
jgi:hypothetical protein